MGDAGEAIRGESGAAGLPHCARRFNILTTSIMKEDNGGRKHMEEKAGHNQTTEGGWNRNNRTEVKLRMRWNGNFLSYEGKRTTSEQTCGSGTILKLTSSRTLSRSNPKKD